VWKLKDPLSAQPEPIGMASLQLRDVQLQQMRHNLEFDKYRFYCIDLHSRYGKGRVAFNLKAEKEMEESRLEGQLEKKNKRNIWKIFSVKLSTKGLYLYESDSVPFRISL